MDIQINLRRGDFEAMHPNAKLFNFDAEKMVYLGNGSESINSQWSTWCACIGMLHFEIEEAQKVAVPEWFVLMPLEIDDFDHPITKALEKGIVKDLSASVIYKATIEAREPTND
ncbi:hypothetical protein SKM57_11285 [Acinetobacter faecalis]|uniref:hypothetical protein n=1 Tax=Acinetobacter faecalis TaxID=2665161 RepID=UPI002A91A66C|nr:hypothetical protein [Acinetobacter faecalis]MDY6469163.1 hypothetical protein [Acinetobacter faecalis]